MENKYYTPTIEEFHVGFECEFYCKVGDPGDICKYIKKELSFTDYVYIVNDNDWVIRVKYLDREDIESLGWVYNPKGHDHYRFKKYSLMHYTENNIENGITIFKDGHLGYIFKGSIKNKSELKVLLKQLRIL